MSWGPNNQQDQAKALYWATLVIASLVLSSVLLRSAKIESGFIWFVCTVALSFGLDFLLNLLAKTPK